MAVSLRNRSFLNLGDFTPEEVEYLLGLAAELKAARREGSEVQRLRGKQIALIFEKDSTRTRTAFEVAAFEQGAQVTYLGPSGSHMGHKETVKDTARVLGRFYQAIEFRGFRQTDAETLARWSGVPVYNGLTDEWHPTQVLADLLTMQEHAGRPLGEISFCYLGDARNNMGDSLLTGGAMMGMDVRLCAPEENWPREDIRAQAAAMARTTGARLTFTADVAEGVANADFLYTDVWVSMGEADSVWADRIARLQPYQVNAATMALTGKATTKFMHCLPAFHNADTEVGREIHERFGLEAMEVTEQVFESPASIVFDQAENRMHTIKAVLVATLARDGIG